MRCRTGLWSVLSVARNRGPGMTDERDAVGDKKGHADRRKGKGKDTRAEIGFGNKLGMEGWGRRNIKARRRRRRAGDLW